MLLVSLWLAGGCGPSDPFEEVRVLQDEQSDFRGSLEPLREWLEVRPDDPEVHYRYGLALVATGAPGLGVWPLEKAMQSPDWLEKAGLALAVALNSQDAHAKAIEVCSRILEENPDHIPARLLRATTRINSRRGYDEVLADAQHVLDLQPDQTEAQALRVLALFGLDRVDEGGAALEELESSYRDDTLALHGSPALCLAHATFAKEKAQQESAGGEADLELAERRYEMCLEQFPTEALVLQSGITFFDEIGRPERSEALLRRAIDLVPGASSYRVALALRLAGADRADEAEALLREGTELASPIAAADAWTLVASFNVDHGDLDEAIEAFAEAHALVDITQDPQLLLAYTDALVMAKRLDEAEQLVARMTVPAHRSMVQARIELVRGNPGAALGLFDEGMRIWPNNPQSRFYAAIAAEQFGDFARAIEEYRYSMRIDVAATEAYLRLARLQEAAGQGQAALATLAFRPGGRPREAEAGLLEVRIRARLGQEGLASWIGSLSAPPEHRAAAVAALGEGVRARSGPQAALEAMRAVQPIDLSDPLQVEALAAIVEDLAAIGKPSEGLELVEAGLRKHPDAAAFLALRGRALQLAGAPVASAREAFERALAIDAKHPRAVVGLARLEAEAGSTEAALALYDRAPAGDERDPAAAREAASLLVGLGRSTEAEARLASLLSMYPYDTGAAGALVELRLARGADDERTLELARRAVAFGGGADARARLERILPPAEPSAASGP